jgi:hypothetical protein
MRWFLFLFFPFVIFGQEQIQVAANPTVSREEAAVLVEGISVVEGGILVDKIPRNHGVAMNLSK